MHRRRNEPPRAILNRIAQWNVAIAVAIGLMVRCSMEFTEPSTGRPDPVFVLGFLLCMIGAVVLALRLRNDIGALTDKRHRVLLALASFALQLVVLQVLITFVAE